MKKFLVYIILACVLFDCHLLNASQTRVYTPSSNAFTVNIPYIQLGNKRFYLNVNEVVYRKNLSSQWVDFSTPPELSSEPSKYMYMTVEYTDFGNKKNNSDGEFYSGVRKHAKTHLIQKINRLFTGTADTQFISSRELKINGNAAYQVIANISTARHPDKPIKAIFTFINFHHHGAFISEFPVLFTANGMAAYDSSQAQIIHWKEYNQLLYSLRSGG